eukprot:m.1041522 g.1041522  ORF g.1041522 m.1041522 type:complete len:275 (-) comp24159_c0_seq18:3001-3825(-)
MGCRVKTSQQGAGEQADLPPSNSHYEKVAEEYGSAFFYDTSGPFVQWMLENCGSALGLDCDHKVADVGGGDGIFSCALMHKCGNDTKNLTVVDPSQSMLDKGHATSTHSRVCTSADEWCSGAEDSKELFDRILLKEVIHHVPRPRQPLFERLLSSRLAEGGKLLVVTRPQTDIDYPLFSKAKIVWVKNQPRAEDIMEDMTGAGFSDVSQTVVRYKCYVGLDQWCKMMHNRFWSTFSHFSDEDLAAGIEEVRKKFKDSNTIEFEERIVLISGSKK